MSAPKGTKAYSIALPEFVVFAKDEMAAIEEALAVIEDGALLVRRLTPDELRREFGSTYPCQSYDPDREMTCREIADAMEREQSEKRS